MNKTQQIRNEKEIMKVSRNFWLNQFDNFVEGTDLKTNEYCNVYRRIISNPKYASHLDYDLKRRMFNMSKYAYNRELINKPFLNNLINCHINEVKGYYIENGKKVYRVETYITSNGKTYQETIAVNEKMLYKKMQQSYVSAKEIERDTKL